MVLGFYITIKTQTVVQNLCKSHFSVRGLGKKLEAISNGHAPTPRRESFRADPWPHTQL